MNGIIKSDKPIKMPSKQGGHCYLVKVEVEGERCDLWLSPACKNFGMWEFLFHMENIEGIILEGLQFVSYGKLNADFLTKTRIAGKLGSEIKKAEQLNMFETKGGK